MQKKHPFFFLKCLTLRQEHRLALGLIFLISTLKFAAMNVLVVNQDSVAAVVNVSGRQRMLSQRTAFFSSSFMTAQSQEDRDRIHPKLLATINELEQNHADLLAGNPDRNLPALTNKDVYDIYYGQPLALNDLLKKYIESVDVIIDNNGQEGASEKAIKYIFDIGPDVLLDKLDAVVAAHEAKARNDFDFIARLQTLFWALTLLVLFLEARLLFKPTEDKIKAQIAELKNREQKIQEQLKEMEHFTYIASHDLQEPLRKIIGFTQRLDKELQGKLDDKTQTYINFVSAGALHMRELVKGLHSYANVTAAEDNVKDINTEKSIQSALQTLGDKIDFKAIEIHYSNLPMVRYNQAMLARIFEELIGNAVKYKNSRPLTITIDAVNDGANWTFSISDNGIGIEEKFIDRIFIMFQRLHRKEDIPGTGLGLSIVKKIIERHGGKIWATSEVNKGSCFYFTIQKDTK